MKTAQVSSKLNIRFLKEFLETNLALFGVLFGFIVISVATGQFSNYDSQLEYTAALGVIEWGFPYLDFGHFINQPPLGFYIASLFLRVFGSSYTVAVTVTTLFGAACVFLVYTLGKILYGKQTGLLAAAIFAATPWHVLLSRSFLIDAQCLFFSLLYLLVGILATKKKLNKTSILSGTIFGVAFLTKAFAVFMLVPLVLFYFYFGSIDLKRTLRGILFFVPSVILVFVWYELISGQGFFYAFTHDDFFFILEGAAPSYFFVVNYLVGMVGGLFLVASAVSLIIPFIRQKNLRRILGVDLICLATIAAVVGVNMYLAIGKNLVCPYTNPIKYDYQLLPMLCLLAGSLITKAYKLESLTKSKSKQDKLIVGGVVLGLVLILVSMIQNLYALNVYSAQSEILVNVEREIFYSFNNVTVNSTSNSLVFQLLGFVILALSLVWANKDKLKTLMQTRHEGHSE